MKKKVQYKNEPVDLKIIKDFLPSPDQLVEKEKSVKVTLALSESSVEYFKSHAKRTHSHYQTMIRKIIDHYVSHYSR